MRPGSFVQYRPSDYDTVNGGLNADRQYLALVLQELDDDENTHLLRVFMENGQDRTVFSTDGSNDTDDEGRAPAGRFISSDTGATNPAAVTDTTQPATLTNAQTTPSGIPDPGASSDPTRVPAADTAADRPDVSTPVATTDPVQNIGQDNPSASPTPAPTGADAASGNG